MPYRPQQRHVQRELHGDSGRFTPRAIALATGSGLLGLLLLVGLVALGTERNPSDAVLQAPASSPSMQPTSARSTPPPKRARVPAVEGFGLAKAKRKLRAAGLEVGDVDRSPRLPLASDYDCRGGSGNGPKYSGPVRVTGSDPYDLDRDGDGDGKACEWS
jgi:hypothetical protein